MSNKYKSAYVFESKDLVIFTNENKIKLSDSDVNVFNAQVQYDIEEDLYIFLLKENKIGYNIIKIEI